MTTPDPAAPPPTAKRPNAFQLLGGVLAAAAGVRGVSKRGRSFADASTGAIVGAVLIFVAVIGAGFYAFVRAIQDVGP